MADSTLHMSDGNIRALAEAVNEKVTELRFKYRKHRGVDLTMPPSLAVDAKLVSTMIHRHRSGDMRHTTAEASALDSVSQWSLQVLEEFTRQKPQKVWRQHELA